MTRPTQDTPRRLTCFAYGAITLCGRAFQLFQLQVNFFTPYEKSYNPGGKIPPVWAIPLSLAATDGIDFSFSSYRYLDVSVPCVGDMHLCIQYMTVRESRDQNLFDNSPGLIAVLNALQSLLMPRHPPCALSSLITNIQYSVARVSFTCLLAFVELRSTNCNEHISTYY